MTVSKNQRVSQALADRVPQPSLSLSVTTVTVSDQKKITGHNDTLPCITYSHDGSWHTIVFVTSLKSLPSMSTSNLCALKDINLKLFEVLPCSKQLVFPPI